MCIARFSSLLIAFSLSVISLPVVQAGMSVGFEDLEGVIKSNPQFDSLFIDNLQFAPTGTATRLGRHYGAVSGMPVGPYQFKARFAADEGEEFPIMAVLHTQLIFENANREITENPGETASVRERLVRVELIDTSEMTPEEITKALSQLFEGAESAEPSEAPMNQSKDPAATPGALGEGAFGNELKDGDRMFAGQYFCDDYIIAASAGQKIHVEFQPDGFIPVILSKQDGRYSLSAGRYDGSEANERATLTYETPKAANVIVSLVTRDEGETGSYEALFTLDGKVLTPTSNGGGKEYVTLE